VTRLTILHTNDLHGRVPQLMRIATLVRRIRRAVEAAGGYCLYVDAGDSEDTTLLESSLTKGSAMNAILRGAGCDYVALGNSIPLRYGPQAIADMAKHFGRPLLCANLCDSEGRLVAGLEPFTVQALGDLQLGLIGLTAPIPGYATFFKLQAAQPEAILPGLIEEANARGAKTIVVISHLASHVDQALAEKIPGVHLIIGGHDHKALHPPITVNGTIIAQAGEYGNFLGQLDLEVDPATGAVTRFEGTLLPIDETIPPDPEAEAVVESERVRVQKIMSRVIGTLTTAFDLADDRECAAGNLLADALLERVPGAEIAIALAGHWETGLEAGPLTQGMLFAAHRSTANPGKLELTGEQIRRYMSIALKPENAAQTHHGLRGRKMGLPHVAGMTVRYDPSNLEALEIQVGDQPLEKDRKYIVATTDMEFSDWVGYLVIPDEEVEYEVPTITPEVVEEYVMRHTPVTDKPEERLQLWK
jgi:2',3'-cyclic-nucleotide 2'-phosphodiesterase (5'-nucleotidase family)